MIDIRSSTAQRAEDGRIVIAVFDGEPDPVVVLRCTAESTVGLLVNLSLALAERDHEPPTTR